MSVTCQPSACQGAGFPVVSALVVIQTFGDLSLKSEGMHRRVLNLAWEWGGLVGKK